ncbi:MAG: glycoside hydrolase family 97 N-terminal domain-containing protein, partial [Ignavibacteriales bacterium]|nr:glycoside hydrolase family 97 N-terminal domain-containing protein [Ignavibacteriales bacterium]
MKSLLILLVLASSPAATQIIISPSGTPTLRFTLSKDGEPQYELLRGRTPVLRAGKLGLDLKDQPSLLSGFRVASSETTLVNQRWNPVWGEEREIRNHYRELAVTLQQANAKNRSIVLRFRLFDDGLGFRYEFPKQTELNYFTVTDEKTEFNLTGDHTAFWIPGDYDTNEYEYSTTKLSAVDATRGLGSAEIATRTLIRQNAVQTPLMMKTSGGLYLNIHEAALVDYPAMNLVINQQTFGLTSHLVPDPVGNKAYLQTPCTTPWRTIIVGSKAADILASRIVLNLNEPSKIKDPSWIKPQKFVGIWWELHVGKSSWNYADVDNVSISGTDWSALTPNSRHGATTERTKVYIDFAAKHGIDGVLVEGWNVGWEDWFGKWKEEVFDFVTPYPDFD